MSRAQRSRLYAPRRLAAGEASDQIVSHVGGVRARDLAFGVTLGAVVEQGARSSDCRGSVSNVVGHDLVDIGAAIRSDMADCFTDHVLGEFDNFLGGLQIGSGHGHKISDWLVKR